MSERLRSDQTRQRFWAWFVIAVGALIAILCGAFALAVVGASVVDAVRRTIPEDSAAGIVGLALVAGAVPGSIGAILIIIGRRHLRSLD